MPFGVAELTATQLPKAATCSVSVTTAKVNVNVVDILCCARCGHMGNCFTETRHSIGPSVGGGYHCEPFNGTQGHQWSKEQWLAAIQEGTRLQQVIRYLYNFHHLAFSKCLVSDSYWARASDSSGHSGRNHGSRTDTTVTWQTFVNAHKHTHQNILQEPLLCSTNHCL